jgi:hypothetical protein
MLGDGNHFESLLSTKLYEIKFDLKRICKPFKDISSIFGILKRLEYSVVFFFDAKNRFFVFFFLIHGFYQ